MVEIIRSRIILFIIQISILFLIIQLLGYKFDLNLSLIPPPANTTAVQIGIIMWLVNYIMYEDLTDLFLIFTIWLSISIIPICIYNNYMKAYSMNLTTFFFPNFFFYVFYWRYSETYFSALFSTFIIRTIILGLTIVTISIVLSLFLKFIISFRTNTKTDNLEQIESLNRVQCPKCGTQFDSILRGDDGRDFPE